MTPLLILIGILLFLFGFIVGVLVSAWYYFHVIKEVNEEQAGGPSKDEAERRRKLKDDEIDFDC
jgi:uncharacterized membrane protein YciS (DUF1049 family)